MIIDPPTPKPVDTPKATPKKTLDLLFEMKQCKTPGERQAKKVKQEFAKRRAQHRKRAICGLALANYVDQAFGLDRATLEKQISTNEKTKTPTTTEVNRIFFDEKHQKSSSVVFLFRVYRVHLIN